MHFISPNLQKKVLQLIDSIKNNILQEHYFRHQREHRTEIQSYRLAVMKKKNVLHWEYKNTGFFSLIIR